MWKKILDISTLVSIDCAAVLIPASPSFPPGASYRNRNILFFAAATRHRSLQKGPRVSTDMLDVISSYENYLVTVKKASNNTVSSYIRDIRQFSEWLHSNEDLDLVHASQLNIQDYLADLRNSGRSAATVSRALASLKNFFSYLVSTGHIDKAPCVASIHIERAEKKLPQILTGKEVELLLSQPLLLWVRVQTFYLHPYPYFQGVRV